MHYRWSQRADRHLAGTRLAEEVVRIPGVPKGRRRRWVARRQTKLFVAGDGVDERTRTHAEGAYLSLLAPLEPIFSRAPVHARRAPDDRRLRAHGPFWRHFVHDPTPARLMQERAPAIFEWAARTWNARASRLGDRADPRRRPGRLVAAPARDRGDAPRGARGRTPPPTPQAKRRTTSPSRARPTAHPDQRLPALVPSSAPGRLRVRWTAGRAERSARSSSATVAGSRSGGSPSSPATTTRTARRRSAG